MPYNYDVEFNSCLFKAIHAIIICVNFEKKTVKMHVFVYFVNQSGEFQLVTKI